MAAGDAVSAVTSVAAAASLTIQPGSGAEWVIHNLEYAATSVTLYKSDGTHTIAIYSDTAGPGALLNVALHATNSLYFILTNTSGSTAYLSYDGMATK